MPANCSTLLKGNTEPRVKSSFGADRKAYETQCVALLFEVRCPTLREGIFQTGSRLFFPDPVPFVAQLWPVPSSMAAVHSPAKIRWINSGSSGNRPDAGRRSTTVRHLGHIEKALENSGRASVGRPPSASVTACQKTIS